MHYVRWRAVNLAQAVWLCGWSVLCISVALLASVFSREMPLVLARRLWAPPLLWSSLSRYEVDGAALVDFDPPDGRGGPHGRAGRCGPCVFVMNHQSMLDIAIAFAFIPVNLRFVAKKILAYVPFLGWYMWRTGMVFVDRSSRAQALRSLRRAGERVRAGASILAYPEGTRSVDGRILPFKKGPFVVAIEAGVPIVPVAVEGSYRVLPRGGFRVRPGTVRLRIGAPIPTSGRTHADLETLIRQVRDAMIDLHVSIGGQGGDRDDAIALPGREGVGGGSRRARPRAA